jgi:hypothetical protein
VPAPTPVTSESCCVNNTAWVTGTNGNWLVIDCATHPAVNDPTDVQGEKCQSYPQCTWTDCAPTPPPTPAATDHDGCCIKSIMPGGGVGFYPCHATFPTITHVHRGKTCDTHSQCEWSMNWDDCNTDPTPAPTPNDEGTCCVNNPAYGGVLGDSGVPACSSASMQWATKCEPGSALPGPVSQCQWASGDWCVPTPPPTPSSTNHDHV